MEEQDLSRLHIWVNVGQIGYFATMKAVVVKFKKKAI